MSHILGELLTECLPLPTLDGAQVRAIPGYTGYAVTSTGCVLSCRSKHGYRDIWRRLKEGHANNGYCVVALLSNGRQRTFTVHRLVLRAFTGDDPKGMQCRHLNGNKHDNRVVNLQWGTRRENAADSRLHGTMIIGDRSPWAKLTSYDVARIRKEYAEGRTMADMAREVSVSHAAVWQIVRGRQWKHIGGQDGTI